MPRTLIILLLLIIHSIKGFTNSYNDSTTFKLTTQYTAAINYTDAAINSISALNSLIKKENYRNRISSFNNPANSDMGFNLQLEINTALKPLLIKAKNINSNKFMDIVGSLLGNQNKLGISKNLIPASGILSTITSLVANLTVTEKHITQSDLDSFMINIEKYFWQYEKLDRINQKFDINIIKIDLRLQELQIDLKDYLLDLSIAYNPTLQRGTLKQKNSEELLLKYLDKVEVEKQINNSATNIIFPSDAIKTAKEITSTLEKIFAEYQQVYLDNYNDIKNVLLETKQLGNNINKQTIDNSLSELQTLYNESKTADALILRISTLTERLKNLVATEKLK